MEETRCAPKYSKFIIKWSDGSFGCVHSKEKFVISMNGISFERKTEGLIMPEGFDNDNIKWNIKINNFDFEDKFDNLCDCFLRTMDTGNRFCGCDVDIFSVEVILYDGTKIKRDYMGNLEANFLFELSKEIRKFIPAIAPTPYFLCFVEEYEDDEDDDLPFFNVDKETQFFIDVDRENTIVRKRKNVFELEVISKERPHWRKTVKNDSYEREYYLGQGNTCLFDIKLDKVLQKFREWDIPLKLLDEE